MGNEPSGNRNNKNNNNKYNNSNNNNYNQQNRSPYGNNNYKQRQHQQQKTQNNNSNAVWSCPTCTFENKLKDELCQMCYNGDRPAFVQCPQCKDYIVKSDYDTHRLSHQMEQMRIQKQRERERERQRQQEEDEKRQARIQAQRQAQLRQQREEQQRQQQLQQQGRLQRTESQERVATFLGVLTARILGFEFATQENCDSSMRKLHSSKCEKQTALRDAIALGIGRMMQLKDKLDDIDALDDHRFINIILTDGEDTSSKGSRAKFLAMQHLLDQANFHQICKMIFVGVGLNKDAEKELKLYSLLGGKHAEFRTCSDTEDIGTIFNHISLNLIRKTRMLAIKGSQGTAVAVSQERELAVGVNHFIVLLTLDISGSMAGGRWKAVKQAVKKLLDNLKSTDMFAIILFNNEVTMITGS